jgi:hypothetical protein
MAKTYAEQLADWRVQRQQRDVEYRVDQIRQEHSQIARERDIAIAENDLETAELRDYDCQQLEQEYRQMVPQQPQIPQGILKWAQRNPRFFERHGLQASAAVDGALQYMMRPKNPVTNRPDSTGMGWSRDKVFQKDGHFTPQAVEALETLLQMHGPAYFGVTYDPEEKGLHWVEAAKASGLDHRTYTACYNEMKKQGRIS